MVNSSLRGGTALPTRRGRYNYDDLFASALSPKRSPSAILRQCVLIYHTRGKKSATILVEKKEGESEYRSRKVF